MNGVHYTCYIKNIEHSIETKEKPKMNIEVSSDHLTMNGVTYKCAVGKGGIRANKKEGDKATPVGTFPIRRVFYRPDRIEKPDTPFETVALSKQDGWSDDLTRPEYNQLITLPYSGSHEELWREDHLYDVIVELGYNDDPPIPGKGSAIFMHVASETYSPTAGCIVLSLPDLLEILKKSTLETKISISG